MNRFICTTLLLLASLYLNSCQEAQSSESGKFKIVATGNVHGFIEPCG
ncbi:MAG: hypothetical protein KAU50_03610 [Candidatus Marinimicrobia bacterium]|nr:hypothetical protein [Candidatus Neomarinimicrobiota bacterium]